VTSHASTAVAAQALKKRALQIDLANRAISRGDSGGIGKRHHVEKKRLFARGAGCAANKQSGKHGPKMAMLESAIHDAPPGKNSVRFRAARTQVVTAVAHCMHLLNMLVTFGVIVAQVARIVA
jgi:hypothetical protein